jgi:transcriptional regulator with XRE-family HTH domain
MNKRYSLGSKLRSIRDERGLSQRELALASGISPNAISLIERDENSPSVSTLQSLASALNVRMSYFFDEDEPRSVLHMQAGRRPAISSRGVKIEGIGGELPHQEIEPFVISLDPHSEIGDRQVVHTGHELVYCLKGNVEYIVDGTVYRLDVGDILMFEAHLPHIWRNTTDEDAKFLLVLQTPGESDEPVERHFSSYPSLKHIAGS